MPRHPNPTLYTYQLVNVPVQVMYLGPGKLVKVTCDWMGHFAQHLRQGWKLTDIFWDQGKRSHGGESSPFLTFFWFPALHLIILLFYFIIIIITLNHTHLPYENYYLGSYFPFQMLAILFCPKLQSNTK